MAHDSLDKKTLKQDPFQDFVFQGVGYIHSHRRNFILGAVALVLVIVLTASLVFYNRYQAGSQAQDFYLAEKVYNEFQMAPTQRREQSRKAFNQFLEAHPGSKLAPFAWMYMARMALEEGNTTSAADAYQMVVDHGKSQDTQLSVALVGLAKLEEDKQEWDKAAAHYRALPDSFRDLMELNLGRIALLKGKWDEAKTHLKAVEPKEGTSVLTPLAEKMLLQIPAR
ncbi:MAG: tetratricopeptide repeat protein [Deltaproteobacteria bacterium]|nr:tetratricopeptide repeat protein [Deltaproteobacteria bacterium]